MAKTTFEQLEEFLASPEDLIAEDEGVNIVPEEVQAAELVESLRRRKHALSTQELALVARHPWPAVIYAKEVLKGPFVAAEKVIATHAHASYEYARHVLKAPFKAGEKAIATDADVSYDYAKEVLKGPFKAGERAMASECSVACWYGQYVLKGRFALGEDTISADPYHSTFTRVEF